MREKVHICLISDDNYVMPTSTAIRSLIKSKRPDSEYVVHIVASALKEESKRAFLGLGSEKVELDVVECDPSIFSGLHVFDEKAICVASISALFKFLLAEIFPRIDKLLYIDGDLICREDLSELYATELGGAYAAAVPDSGQIYYRHKYVKLVKRYVNSGVMLLNLKLMRELGLKDKLIETKRALSDSNLMDQNVFNVVFDGHLKYLPIRWNFMPVSLWRADGKWKLEDINRLFETDYASIRDIYADSAIIHYSSKDKPWKTPDGAMSYLWHEYHQDAKPLTDEERDEYVHFMGSENDSIVEGAMEKLIRRAVEDDLDLVIFDGDSSSDHLEAAYPGVWNGAELKDKLQAEKRSMIPTSLMLVRKALLKEHEIAYPELKKPFDKRYFEAVLMAAKRVAVYTDEVYHRAQPLSERCEEALIARLARFFRNLV